MSLLHRDLSYARLRYAGGYRGVVATRGRPKTSMRERILEAAMDVFAEDGIRGARISEVERRVGLAEGTGSLYRHFPSKEALVQAAIEHEVTRMRAEVAQARAEAPVVSEPAARNRQRYTQVLHDMGRFDRLHRLMVNEGDRVPELREAIWAALQRPAEHATANDAVTDAIALAALGGYHFLSQMQGRPFNGIAARDFVEALVAMTTPKAGRPASRR
jgi:AcrR family transcriptional regulator